MLLSSPNAPEDQVTRCRELVHDLDDGVALIGTKTLLTKLYNANRWKQHKCTDDNLLSEINAKIRVVEICVRIPYTVLFIIEDAELIPDLVLLKEKKLLPPIIYCFRLIACRTKRSVRRRP